MGAGQSTPDGRPPARGLHVLRVTPSSPASQTNLEPFFDFIVGYESESASGSRRQVDIEAHDFEHVVEEYEGKQLALIVWSSKTKVIRHTPIVPSRAWSQPQSAELDASNSESSAVPQPSLLGLSMRVCEPEFALDNVWHVLDVLEGSPAESAGLVPYGDWIAGWSGGVLGAEGDFYDLVEAHEDQPLRVYVYSYDFDTLREVVLVPNRQWGGEGLLGCVFGYGLLHRIPDISEEQRGFADSHVDDAAMFIPADSAEDSYNETYDGSGYAEHSLDDELEGHYEGPEGYTHSYDEDERRPDTHNFSTLRVNRHRGDVPILGQESRHYLDPPLLSARGPAPPLREHLSHSGRVSPAHTAVSAGRSVHAGGTVPNGTSA